MSEPEMMRTPGASPDDPERASEFDETSGSRTQQRRETAAETDRAHDTERERDREADYGIGDEAREPEYDDDIAAHHEPDTTTEHGAETGTGAGTGYEPEPTTVGGTSQSSFYRDEDSVTGAGTDTDTDSERFEPAQQYGYGSGSGSRSETGSPVGSGVGSGVGFDTAADTGQVLAPQVCTGFRERWHEIQAEFVDDPRHAVEDADRLVTDLAQAFTSSLEDRRKTLTSAWQHNGSHEGDRGNGYTNGNGDGNGAETEQLRLTMRQYRNLVDRILQD